MKTKKEVSIGYACSHLPVVVFPVGSTAKLASNMGLDNKGEKQYWLSLPRGHKYGKLVTKWARAYGYLVSYTEIA